MKVQTELRIMIKALLLSYLVTGAALLLVAFLLYQMEVESVASQPEKDSVRKDFCGEYRQEFSIICFFCWLLYA